ncbi:MAG: hypothetical protein GY750_06300 [Lentisphaerae bacterium]|nr:hypothetical protein [Lentisphaerota bacterium]MCP4101019.1 hypothetical protein [Lentisphaerota bacterium]
MKNGVIINKFKIQGYYTYQTKELAARNRDLFQYYALMTPELELLKQSCTYRVFHDQDGKSIVESILSAWNIGYEDQTSGGTAEKFYKLEQVFQYGESDFDFISRLMEREGIFYTFAHKLDEKNVLQHKMILRNTNPSNSMNLKYDPDGTDLDVQSFDIGEEIGINSIRLGDYDYREATKWFFTGDDQQVGQKTDLRQVTEKMRLDDPYSQFSEVTNVGEDASYRTKLKTISAQRARAAQFCWNGSTRNREIATGNGFVLESFVSGSIRGLITGLDFEVTTTPYAIEDAYVTSDSKFGLEGKFMAQDLNVPFRPQLTVRQP